MQTLSSVCFLYVYLFHDYKCATGGMHLLSVFMSEKDCVLISSPSRGQRPRFKDRSGILNFSLKMFNSTGLTRSSEKSWWRSERGRKGKGVRKISGKYSQEYNYIFFSFSPFYSLSSYSDKHVLCCCCFVYPEKVWPSNMAADTNWTHISIHPSLYCFQISVIYLTGGAIAI